MGNANPILVTGAHRSGTTWVGKVLTSSPSLAYISEPLNVNHSWGVLAAPVAHWYTYIHPGKEDAYKGAFEDTLQFRFRFLPAVKHVRRWQDVIKVVRDQFHFYRANQSGCQPVVKDPFAVFSIPWFIKTFDTKVVTTIRHPLGFVSSLKRLEWRFDLQNLLSQPRLMADHLEPFRADMERHLQQRGDIIDEGLLLWKMIYSVVAKYRREISSIHVIRHEDLSLQPVEKFASLFGALDLPFTDQIRQEIARTSRPDNPDQLPRGDEHSVRLDSKANLNNWKQRLTASEVKRVLEATENELFGFYEPDEWREW